MPLAPGTRLGRYEILGLIGKGGMGEVYRARDPQLQREVAIKISEEQFTERFGREARAVAALNHPHICTLYDVGPNYLVMEYIIGHPLKGPLPVDQALKYADQICLALDAAHSKQITHRDLKPGNIIVTKTGVKLLDFGLARMGSAADESTLTGTGQVMGTPAYMAPEQWSGKPADARTDIYALGRVLYEMLTGKRAAEERKPVEPLGLDQLLNLCLAQDPEARWQSVKDLRQALNLVRLQVPAAAESPGRQKLPWALVCALAAFAAITFWAPWRRSQTSAAPAGTASIDVDLGTAIATTDDPGPDAILSPDGTRLVFVARGSNDCTSRLLTRLLDRPQPVELPGTEGAYAPFFSPDGRSVGFFTYGRLQKTRVDGGNPVFLCEAHAGRGGSWGQADKIVAALDSQGGLSLVDATSGKSAPLTQLKPDENSHRWPQILPGGKKVLFTRGTTFANFEESSIAVLSLEDRTWTIVLPNGGMYPRYLPTGHLIYITGGTLYARPFDLDSVAIRGPPVGLPEEVSSHSNFGFARLDCSSNGLFLYRRGRTEGLTTMAWMDTNGIPKPLGLDPAVYQFPRLSPDGSKLVWMVNQGPNTDLWTYDRRTERPTRLTAGRAGHGYPVWSRDGRYIVFSSRQGISWTRADSASEPKLLTESQHPQYPASFTPDGKLLAYSELNSNGAAVWIVPVDGSSGQLLREGSPKPFLQTPSRMTFPAFSPDGKWLAYASTENGRYEVSVTDFPEKATKYQVSNGGGIMPVWSSKSHELFYRTLSGCENIMVATYTTNGGVFKAETAQIWSGRRLANTGLTPNFDLDPNGGGFVVLVPAEGSEPPEAQSHVTLVANFFDEVRRLVPVRR
jgi:Tol biopolymer transport system component/predicted Ser/Thr protein kinase